MSDTGDSGKIITGDDWKRRPEDEAGQKPSGGGEDQSKLHIDDDWKAQARAEKERLAQEAEQGGGEGAEAGGPGGREMPPANFQTLLSTIASQALLYMGAIPDPSTGQRIAHLELAKHHIDLLGVLHEKTKGNLEDEEDKMLTQTLEELRMYHTQVGEQLAKQQAEGGGQGGPMGGPGGPMGGGGNPFGGGPAGPMG
ncbi:MAG: DUF1844 domain-containing protein [Phycisphaeraceae bacterium]